MRQTIKFLDRVEKYTIRWVQQDKMKWVWIYLKIKDSCE